MEITWIIFYVVIGGIMANSMQYKGGKRFSVVSFYIGVFLWPFILLIMFIKEIDRLKKRGKQF